ncbi:MAG TPA: hypothetical protein VMR97_12340 [Acidimicrobiales bacterium]|nr:hypothetical protein [Acidimicrobiales bacterium]
MSVVALCSAKRSPGVSTLTCALGAVWPAGRQVYVAECDPSGGDLAVRFGLNPRRGMTSLILARRQRGEGVIELSPHLQPLPGGLEVLVGPMGPDAATALDQELAKLPESLFPLEADTIVDCGRVLPSAAGQRTVLERADKILVLASADSSCLAHARWALERMGTVVGRPDATGLVLTGEKQFSANEVSETLGVEIYGNIPHDPRGAAAACGVPSRAGAFARSSLIAAARGIVHRILPPDASDVGVRDSQRRDARAPSPAAKGHSRRQRRADVEPLTDIQSSDEAPPRLVSHEPSGLDGARSPGSGRESMEVRGK